MLNEVKSLLNMPNATEAEVLEALREMKAKAAHLDKLASGEGLDEHDGIVFAGGIFLCDYLSYDMVIGEESDLLNYISNNAWQPFEHHEPDKILEYMTDAGNLFRDEVKTLASEWE